MRNGWSSGPWGKFHPVVPPRGLRIYVLAIGKNHASDKNQLVITMVWQTLVKTVVRKLVLQGQVKTMVLTKGRFLV